MQEETQRRIWRFVHNVVVHPLMEVVPDRWGDWLHDLTGRKAFPSEDRARVMLLTTRARARMYATTKESLLSRVGAILELSGVPSPELFSRFLDRQGCMLLGQNDAYDTAWAEEVVNYALDLLWSQEKQRKVDE